MYMSRFSSNNVVILCSDDQVELPMLTSKLIAEDVQIETTTLVQLELTLIQNPTASLILSWHKPSAELNVILDFCTENRVPVVMLFKVLNSNNINILNKNNDFVLMPVIAVDSLGPLLIHARAIRDKSNRDQQKIEQLNRKLEERKWVEKAKGMLMKVHSIDEPEAYRALRASAMKNSQPMGIVARNLVSNFELVN
jgi:response regulator NasT